jgi:hypothetical protein
VSADRSGGVVVSRFNNLNVIFIMFGVIWTFLARQKHGGLRRPTCLIKRESCWRERGKLRREGKIVGAQADEVGVRASEREVSLGLVGDQGNERRSSDRQRVV